MNPKELRIGNLVQYSDGGGITEVSAMAMHQMPFAKWSLEPIELTEEWLIRFGFEKVSNLMCDGFEFEKKCFGNKFIVDEEMYAYNGCWTQEIKYVHQLQNLYFALTGKELELKQ